MPPLAYDEADMEHLVVAAAALGGAALTFFSGFGLGTVLLGAFVFWFPLPVAVAATAVVHLANNLFKLALVGRHASWPVAWRFGLPAMAGAWAGARLLERLGEAPVLASYILGGHLREIDALGLAIGLAMVIFAVVEGTTVLDRARVPSPRLALGGLLSGFFGGLSGHQGALRSAWLVRRGLTAEAFVATGVVIAVAVDVTRLAAYAAAPDVLGRVTGEPLVRTAALCAFAGSWLGSRLIRKVTHAAVQRAVALGLLLIGTGLAAGLL